MVRKRVYAIAAAVVVITAASAMGSGLFLDRKEEHVAVAEVRRIVSEEQAKEPGNLAYLRLQIDAQDNVNLLGQNTVTAPWRDREIGPGARLYYEILDEDGTVLGCGVRQDPREMVRLANKAPVNFILAVPREDKTARVVIYAVGYETGGHVDYERSLRPIATLVVE